MTQEQLLSISEASHVLGVSEAALRYWTDEGKIKAFITPGGHRRYSRAKLNRFVSAHSKVPGIRDLITELEYSVQLRQEISQTSRNGAPYSSLSAESRQRLAELGRQLMNVVVRYLSEPANRKELSQFSREIGTGFGVALAQLGLPLTDSVSAFILHRNPIINTTTHFMKKHEALSGRIVDTIPLVTGIMDEALVALVASHQRNQGVLHSDPKGETQK